MSRHCRAYRLAGARCRVAQTVHRTVCYCSFFDSHKYKEKEKPHLKARFLFLERVMGIEPTRPAWKAGILAIELHPHTGNENYNNTNRSNSQGIFSIFINFFIPLKKAAKYGTIHMNFILKGILYNKKDGNYNVRKRKNIQKEIGCFYQKNIFRFGVALDKLHIIWQNKKNLSMRRNYAFILSEFCKSVRSL